MSIAIKKFNLYGATANFKTKGYIIGRWILIPRPKITELN